MEPGSPALQEDSWPAELPEKPNLYAAAAAKSRQSCPTLCDPTDGSPPGPAVPGILQARTLEWVAISFSIAWKWKVKVKSLNRVRPLATPWTAAYQAPPSMGFSRQEYWSGVPSPNDYQICIFERPFMWVPDIYSQLCTWPFHLAIDWTSSFPLTSSPKHTSPFNFPILENDTIILCSC